GLRAAGELCRSRRKNYGQPRVPEPALLGEDATCYDWRAVPCRLRPVRRELAVAGTTSSLLPTAALDHLASQQVVVPRPEEVLAYLEPFRDLADLLPAVCAQARQEFGSEAELSLEVY